MTFRFLFTRFAVSSRSLLAICFILSVSYLYIAETDAGAAAMSPQQIQQIIQNTPPDQIQQMLQNAPPGQIQQITPEQNIPSQETSTIKKLQEETQDGEVEEVEEVEEEFSSIEQLYQQKYSSTLTESLEQYGYRIFESSTDTLSNLAIPSDDYLIGPGDNLRIRFWGSGKDGAYSTVVSREGTIDVPQIGILAIAGTPYGKLEQTLRNEVEKYVQGVNISVSLAELRSVEVYVVGEVNRPGLHLVPAFSTVIGGLIAGDGVKKSGSLRAIKLFRSGELLQVVDLYTLLLHGSRQGDVTLQDGDVLFVPRLGPTAAIAGATIQPAIYELTTETSVADLLELAGGALPQSNTDRLHLRRFDENQQFVVLDIDSRTSKSDLATIAIHNGDLLELQYLESLWPKVVRLEGNVWYPDVFSYRPDMKLSHILTDISLLKPNSITDFALLYRYDPETTRFRVENIPLSDVLNGQYDSDLKPYDTIEILSRDDYGIKEPVKIMGGVWRPGEHVFTPGLVFGDLLSLAGGFRFDADQSRIDLSRQIITDGEVVTSHFTLQADTDASFKLQPYDYIYIRRVKDAASFKSASITGEVKFPGTYRIKDGEHLSDLIERAGGFSDKAYYYGAYFTSFEAKIIQQASIDRMVDDLEMRTQTVLAEQAKLLEDEQLAASQQSALQGLISRLRKVEATGRMSITLGPLATLKDTAFDFELHEGDSLHLPPRPNFVSVVGSVYISKSFMFNTNETLNDYLQKAGGPTKTADKGSMYVVKANGEVLASAQTKGMFNSFNDTVLMPGDTIVVPEDLERVPGWKVFKDVTEVIFKIAATVGIVAAI